MTLAYSLAKPPQAPRKPKQQKPEDVRPGPQTTPRKRKNTGWNMLPTLNRLGNEKKLKF
jgi:hypothetical protein